MTTLKRMEASTSVSRFTVLALKWNGIAGFRGWVSVGKEQELWRAASTQTMLSVSIYVG
jgi:hypothetical protein